MDFGADFGTDFGAVVCQDFVGKKTLNDFGMDFGVDFGEDFGTDLGADFGADFIEQKSLAAPK